MDTLLDWAERGKLPDAAIRMGIRRLLRSRLRLEDRGDAEANLARKMEFVESMRRAPVALHTDDANVQHYEVPPAFFERILGPRLKYSAGHWPAGGADLGAAEDAMLALTAERAGVADGMRVLDLGCGWGSFTLWAAERFPGCRFLAVSNSAPQGEFIRRRAAERRLRNVEVTTADMNHFEAPDQFHRIVSVEMFEHMRNWEALLERAADWLKPGGRMFIHIFTHRRLAYPFETEGADNWMGRHFFTGGMMPSDDLILYFPRHLAVEAHWRVDGRHYQKSLEAWLANLDRQRADILAILSEACGAAEAPRALQRWRMFIMACAELFGYRAGQEWLVSHYRLAPKGV